MCDCKATASDETKIPCSDTPINIGLPFRLQIKLFGSSKFIITNPQAPSIYEVANSTASIQVLPSFIYFSINTTMISVSVSEENV